ncbi:IQ domain-containing protein N [Hemicordylus capensis]|uniref:IQ domain-containing protein N n=1 Tax=Hemicordylus capensis TaxID=884348 RepID=UPI0023024CB3|nr:IQ domain-containing protein N [Hemicordylus capensis]
METYEDHPWCAFSYQSGEDDEADDHHHDPNLAKVRARSNSRTRTRSSFLVDELDMLMDKAATTIQASWRGHLARKHLWTQHAAASTIQAAWRRYITREYLAMQQEQVPSWQTYGNRRRTPSPASLEERRSWGRPQVDREEAAITIQAHYRGYVIRRALVQCHQAATTIQAHWRGYHTRQDLARRPCGRPAGSHYGQPSHGAGRSSSWVGPYPRKHWQKCLVGTPEEWASKVPPQAYGREGEHKEVPPQPKTCPKCGRCTTVRVLVGVGKGPPSESEADESDVEGCSRPPSAHYRSRRQSPASRSKERQNRRQSPASRSKERQKATRQHPCGGPHVSYQVPPKSCCPEEPSRKYGRDPVGLSQRYGTHTAMRPPRERTTARSLSSTSIHLQGAATAGTSDWLYENYCARRMGEGQRRVFKTRKQLWEVVRAATLIQAFWRGCQARRALRQQQRAAITIQSAYRGYKTRVYLIDAGILSEGDTTD